MQLGKKSGIDPVVFGTSFGLVTLFSLLGAVFPEAVGKIAGDILDWITGNLGWVFILAATGFVGFALILAFSRYGRIPLSREGEPPEFSWVSWVAMMFSAGMGIGLMFFGIYEPASHYATIPPGSGAAPGTPEAATTAMGYTLFHWGLHPWAIYAVVGLALAYSTFRKGRGNLLSAPFQSLSRKDRDVAESGWGKAINIWAIVATKFGGATSLGLGALQVAGGLMLFIGARGPGQQQQTINIAFIVIVVLVIFAILSAVSGVARGIKWLSNTNMVLAALLLLFVLVTGPTVFLFNMLPASTGNYISQFIAMSFRSPAFGGQSWFNNWTIFYWAWWISWAPFVSTFIARISRGRTIREFVLGVLIVPTVISGIWFVILGGAAIDLQRLGVNLAGAENEEVAFFTALQQYPGFVFTGGLVMFLTAIFWVSGADASALVLATLSSHGRTHPKRWLIALWAFMSAVVAAVLLLVGGLDALQTFTILVASPFIVIVALLCWALYADLRRDPLRARQAGAVRDHAPLSPELTVVPEEAETPPQGGEPESTEPGERTPLPVHTRRNAENDGPNNDTPNENRPDEDERPQQ